MRPRPGASEWPLVLFTVLTQTSVGLCVARAAFLRSAGARPDPVLLLVLGLLALGATVGILHLGRTSSTRFALANLGSSWLSRELVLIKAFGSAVGAELLTRWLASGSTVAGDVFGAAAVLLGLALIYAMARIYMLRTVPPWNTWVTPFSFFATTFLLGGALLCAVSDAEVGRGLGLAVAGLVVLQALAACWHFRHFDRPADHAGRRAATAHAKRRALLIVRLALAGLGIAAGFALSVTMAVAVAFILLFVSELLGRFLFYASHRRIGL